MKFEELPFVVRAAAVATYGYRNAALRYGREFRQFRRFLAESSSWHAGQIEQWQRAELELLLSASRDNVPAHRYIRDEVVRGAAFRPVRDTLRMLSYTSKDDMRQLPVGHFVNFTQRCGSVSRTSGTSGSPMRFEHDRISIQRRFAFLADHLERIGVALTDRSIRLSGRILEARRGAGSRPWIYNPAEKQMLMSTYHLDELHSGRLCNVMEEFQPTYLDGYPSAIITLLRLMRARGLRLKQLRAIVTTAETLEEDVRLEMESLSGVKVYNYYAASEGVSLIQQCRYSVYHVRWQSGILEVLPSDSSTEGTDGELVCTSFVQRRMPLIRYRTGDIVGGYKAEATSCPCGLTTPTVKHLLGRVEDQVVTADGRSLGMFSYRTLKGVSGLCKCQIIQNTPNEFAIEVVLMPGATIQQVGDQMKLAFERVMGHPVSLEVKQVNEIAHGPSGKFRSVSSRVSRASLVS